MIELTASQRYRWLLKLLETYLRLIRL